MMQNPNTDQLRVPTDRPRFDDPAPFENNGRYGHHHHPTSPPCTEVQPSSRSEIGLPFEDQLSAQTLARRADAAGTRFDARTRARRVRIEQLIQDFLLALHFANQHSESPRAVGFRLAAVVAISLVGLGVAVAAANSWCHWMMMTIDDAVLARLLAMMLPVIAVSLHYWIWRSQEVPRDRAIAAVTVGLVLSGVALVAAVAWRFGVLPSLTGDDALAGAGEAFLQGDDNRWVMISADLIGVCGSALLMAWAEDISHSPVDRIRARLGRAKASLAALDARRQFIVHRALRRGIRVLLKAYRKAA